MSDTYDENKDDEIEKTEDSENYSSKKSTIEIPFNQLDATIIPVENLLPDRLFVIPIEGRPMFPGIFTPLMISSAEDVRAVEKAFAENGFIGIVLVKNEENVEHPSCSDLYQVGTVARIIKKINLPDGGLNVFISTVKRFRITKSLKKIDPIAVAVEYLDDEEDDSEEVKALTRALVSEMKEVSENNPLFSEEMRLNMVNIDHPGKIADFIASILNIEKAEQQKVLELVNVRTRMEQVLVYIKKEQELFRIQKKIQSELNEKVEKNQRESFLREELKTIQEELGAGKDGSDYQKFKAKIDEFKFDGEIKETLDNELEKFRLMDPDSSEYFVSRNYLELVVSLPWKIDTSQENYDLAHAYRILEKDHYGLEDVKKRILEYLAVRRLKEDSKGSIMILVGPPGVGKTSIGHSIAEAMNKPFYRFSVGGIRDEAEIKGHRRTYIGALPGKIIQGLKITKSASPVFLIDEVDKMGASYSGGDPASALLEVLDPEQNVNFRDTYLDLPFDVSNVFFILTANSLDTIPGPLLDRAEIISLSGYIDQEKIEIAKKYLIPKNLKKNGLLKNQVKYTKEALLRIAEEYAREAGVRHYEKCIDKIHRKLALEKLTGILPDAKKLSPITKTTDGDVVEDFKKSIFVIGAEELDKYLGKPVFDESEIKRADKPGTCIGLAWTSMGGDTLLIEAITFPSSKGGLQLTGQMGDVMKESAEIAMNWVKRYAIEKNIKSAEWFERNVIHLHIPEGATPKDGPSAGITMATTFMSLLTDRVVKPNVAMTGELDLTGQVMPIGGLREKTVAAKRNGIKTIFIPKANERDLDLIPEHVKSGIKFIPVRQAMEVMTEVFQPKKALKVDDDYGF
ncbi:MAG: endopeptidase La [Treponema sp.]|nr:endopeptidase La [Treponema sp.]